MSDGVFLRVPTEATLSRTQLLELSRLNPTLRFVQYLPAKEGEAGTEAASHHRESVSTAVSIIQAILETGVQLLPVPAALRGLVDGIIDKGVPVVAAAIRRDPVKERWTLDEIRALNKELQALPDPRT